MPPRGQGCSLRQATPPKKGVKLRHKGFRARVSLNLKEELVDAGPMAVWRSAVVEAKDRTLR